MDAFRPFRASPGGAILGGNLRGINWSRAYPGRHRPLLAGARRAQHVIPAPWPMIAPAPSTTSTPQDSTFRARPSDFGRSLFQRGVSRVTTENPVLVRAALSDAGQKPTTWKGGNVGDRLMAQSRPRRRM